MDSHKILSLLGLALRGNHLAVGEEPVEAAARAKDARLLLLASDAADNTDVYKRQDPESSRTFSLLSRLGLADRIVGQGNTADLEAPVDWKQAEVRLSEARAASLNYLRAALEGTPYTQKTAEIAPDAPPRLADHGH